MRASGLLATVMMPALAVPALSPAAAQIPADRPFAMRGVELGISVTQFRELAVPVDEDRYFDPRIACSNDQSALAGKITVPAEDRASGIVDCKWFSRTTFLPGLSHQEHWIRIGTGSGIPTFRFIPVAGELRLFRVSFYANEEYYAGILDALTRGYGSPATRVEPFQTVAGAHYTSATSTWRNSFSSITLVQRCGHLERYCLTYDHTAYAAIYRTFEEQRAAAAASRI